MVLRSCSSKADLPRVGPCPDAAAESRRHDAVPDLWTEFRRQTVLAFRLEQVRGLTCTFRPSVPQPTMRIVWHPQIGVAEAPVICVVSYVLRVLHHSIRGVYAVRNAGSGPAVRTRAEAADPKVPIPVLQCFSGEETAGVFVCCWCRWCSYLYLRQRAASSHARSPALSFVRTLNSRRSALAWVRCTPCTLWPPRHPLLGPHPWTSSKGSQREMANRTRSGCVRVAP
jgi:hypothetical protein